jgi:hypothetical protein
MNRTSLLGMMGVLLALDLAACSSDDSPGDGAGGASAAGASGQAGTGQGGQGNAGQGQAGSGQAGSGQAGQGQAGSGQSGNGQAGALDDLPAAGNPDGKCEVPAEAQAEDSSTPTTVVGTGTAASCTGAAVVAAVAKGGVVTFACGPDPVTITLTETARVFNDKGPKIVIDGGGKVTLSGGGKVPILYQDTCDEKQVYTSSHCQDQDTPQLTVQNLTLVDGNATGQTMDGGGGGAIFVRGGRVKIINSRFFRNRCDPGGPDVGGAAVRVLSQSQNKPVYVVHSTFGGREDLGNSGSNGGGLSSIGVSYTVINSLFSHNQAIGSGANPATSGTPGGGSGGAIYNDGNTYTLTLCGDHLSDNTANEGGGAIFFVSNDKTGSLIIKDSVLSHNPSAGFETKGYPGIFVIAKGDPEVSGSTLE